MTADPRWRVRDTRYLYESQWFSLRQDDITLPGGEDIVYTFVDHPGYAMVLPVRDDGQVVLVNVYRHPLKKTCLECPAGGLDGGDPLETARRELEEETGYRAKSIEPIGSYFGAPGSSNEFFHLFIATGLTEDGTIAHEVTEQIDVVLMPFTELYRRVVEGKTDGGPTALCVLLAGASGRIPVSDS